LSSHMLLVTVMVALKISPKRWRRCIPSMVASAIE
jgi:hypothetical protein